MTESLKKIMDIMRKYTIGDDCVVFTVVEFDDF